MDAGSTGWYSQLLSNSSFDVKTSAFFDPKIESYGESYGDVTLDFRELWGLLRNSEIL